MTVFATTLLAIGGASGLLALSRIMLSRELRVQSDFARASGRVSLGLPAIADGNLTDDKRQELEEIGQTYSDRFRQIKRVLDDFQLSGSLTVHGQGERCVIRRPRNYFQCDVILGESVAGAKLSPGTAIYWLPLPGHLLAEKIDRTGPSITGSVSTKALDIFVEDDTIKIVDRRLGALPNKTIALGTPILLALDENSETAMSKVFGGRAPQPGTMTKVRLFGGFKRDLEGNWKIVPLRQGPGAHAPTPGQAEHPISSLRGVIVASSQHLAFPWTPRGNAMPVNPAAA